MERCGLEGFFLKAKYEREGTVNQASSGLQVIVPDESQNYPPSSKARLKSELERLCLDSERTVLHLDSELTRPRLNSELRRLAVDSELI